MRRPRCRPHSVPLAHTLHLCAALASRCRPRSIPLAHTLYPSDRPRPAAVLFPRPQPLHPRAAQAPPPFIHPTPAPTRLPGTSSLSLKIYRETIHRRGGGWAGTGGGACAALVPSRILSRSHSPFTPAHTHPSTPPLATTLLTYPPPHTPPPTPS